MRDALIDYPKCILYPSTVYLAMNILSYIHIYRERERESEREREAEQLFSNPRGNHVIVSRSYFSSIKGLR